MTEQEYYLKIAIDKELAPLIERITKLEKIIHTQEANKTIEAMRVMGVTITPEFIEDLYQFNGAD